MTIELREFQTEDFDVFQDAYLLTWGHELADAAPKERSLAGEAYLAGNLAQSNWVRVSTVKGQPAGLLCAQFADGDDFVPDAAAYLSVMQQATEQLKASTAGQNILRFVEQLHVMNRGLLAIMKDYGLPKNCPEVVYFIAHPQFRGKGAGKALLNAFYDECRRRGVPASYLFTDNHCSWKGYLRDGWKVMGEAPWKDSDMVTYGLVKRYA